MSTIVMVLICVAVVTIIGLRVYFEHKEETDKEDATKEDVFADLQAFVINPKESTATPVAIEEKPENQPVSDTPNPAIIEVEPINSAAAKAELKPKKKKRYYGKKKLAIKKAVKKQNKK